MDAASEFVLVTGGSRGIGAATARLAAEHGYDMCISYRDRADSAQAVVAEIEATGMRALAVRADVSQELQNIRRSAAVFSLAVHMMGAGSASAWAWTWASSTSPIGVSSDGVYRGGGYGSATATSYSQGQLRSYLRDAKLDDMRTFVDVFGQAGAQSGIGVQSGRRSDGGNTYALMADKTFYAEYPKGVGAYTYYVKVCMDRSWSFDPCSSVRSHAGL